MNKETVGTIIELAVKAASEAIATLELVNRICELATIFSDNEIASLSWSDFVSSLDQGENSELITYLKERMLYVNEPIEPTENDD